MDSDPIATPVHIDVLWEGPHVHPPHVVIALHESPVQSLLLDKPMKQNVGGMIGAVYSRWTGLEWDGMEWNEITESMAVASTESCIFPFPSRTFNNSNF